VAGEDRHDVEAHRGRARAGGLQVAEGEAAEAQLLRAGDRLERAAEPVGAARLHLHEHEQAAAGDHEVELAVAATPVAVDDAVAAGPVPGRRPLLSRGAVGPTGIRHSELLAG
jgi:hypothetical protein